MQGGVFFFLRRAYLEAPFDLMYGFRGVELDLQLLSPFEMLMQYSMEEVRPPNAGDKNPNAILTDKGLQYLDECSKAKKHRVTKQGCITKFDQAKIAFCCRSSPLSGYYAAGKKLSFQFGSKGSSRFCG